MFIWFRKQRKTQEWGLKAYRTPPHSQVGFLEAKKDPRMGIERPHFAGEALGDGAGSKERPKNGD